MKVVPFCLTLITAIASLVLSALLFFSGRATHELQETLATQNRTIQQGASSAQIHQRMLGDLARLSLEHPKIRELLEKNGYHVERRTPPAAPQPEAAPAASPEATPDATPEATPAATPEPTATPRSSRNKNSSRRSR
ncbi:MAG TPA: hypothetical protein VNQ90_18780 [Chthoniobacteraceae bacterium]|nr:hypothetical protein [Chthoniobacteraceae bacterium]